MFKLSELCQVIDGAAICPYDDFCLKGISTDSRTLKKADVFFALIGEKFDGHEFCMQAVRNGAKVLVVEKIPQPLPLEAVVVKVKDTLKAYQEIAAFYRSKFNIPIVAITGSTGKTSTKDILAAILGKKLKTLKSYANFNNEIGVPATILQLKNLDQALVLEMGMRGLGQIKQLAEVARPTIGIITNIGKNHIELLQSIENISLAKQELLTELPEEGYAILNYDDPYTKKMAETVKAQVIYFGLDPSADFFASEIRVEGEGTFFNCQAKLTETTYQVYLPLVGLHNVYNSLAAIAAATILGVEEEYILAGLEECQLSAMRQNIEKIAGMTFVDDTYNASPDSMKAALEVLKSLPAKRKIAVLGDMLELGDLTTVEHTQLGKLVGQAQVDLLITIGNKSYHTSATATEYGVRTWHFKSQFLAANTIVNMLSEGDVILFKASRGVHLDELLNLVKQALKSKSN